MGFQENRRKLLYLLHSFRIRDRICIFFDSFIVMMSQRKDSIMAMLLEFSMFPLGKGESLSEYVAGSLEIIDRSGLPYRMNSMGTVLEGEWDEVMEVVRQCLEKMSEKCNRVDCVMKFDWRRDATDRLTGKIASVEEKLGRELKK